MIDIKCPRCTYPMRNSGNGFKCDNCGAYMSFEKIKSFDKKIKKKVIN